MKFKLIYPKWPKLERQTEFHLPPHGPVVFAATLPDTVEVDFVDENLEEIDFDDPVDFVGISMMLTVQVKRGWDIGDLYRKKGIKVIFGGIAAMLHAEETALHADSVFLGEAEGRMEEVFADFHAGRLQEVYDYLDDRPPIEMVGTARREILNRPLIQLPGRTDGRSGPCLARLPISLLPLCGGLSGRTGVQTAAHRQSDCGNGLH